MRLTDPRAIRGLAHPLRLDLIELLGGISPATAARCAAVLGVSQASASYHLRQLAKYGFVEAAESSDDQRERPWRVVSRTQQVGVEGPAADELSRVLVERETTRILEFIDRRETETDPWRAASFLDAATLPLTADELQQVHAQLRTILEPYLRRVGDAERPRLPADGRWVRLFLAATPYLEMNLDELGREGTGEEER